MENNGTLSRTVLEKTESSHTLSCKYNDPSNQEAPSTEGRSSESNQNQKSYKCEICSLKFFRLSHLKDHMNRHCGNRSYQCKEVACSKAYFAWKHLRKHLIDSHKLENVRKSSYIGREDGKKFKCNYEGCNAAFDRPGKLRSHTSTHTGEKLHSCTEQNCNKAYSNVAQLRRHIANSHTPKHIVEVYSCLEVGCEIVCRSMEHLRKHYMIHVNKDRPKEPSFKCTSCNREFATAGKLTSHRCAFLGKKCKDCNLEFNSISAWKNHLKLHQSFKCDMPECDEVFPEHSLLKEHKRLKHKQSFTCYSCNKKFASKSTLKDHQQIHLIYDERKFFPCPIIECSRFYTRKSNLHQHIRSKHKDIKFKCPVHGCEKRLVTKQKLQEHLKLHDPFHERRQQKQIARRQRKDAGKPKRSMAAKLSGLEVSYVVEKCILQMKTNNQVNEVTLESCDKVFQRSE